MAAAAEALKQSPLARVKEEFGGKDKLVDKIVGVLDSGDESKDELRRRLLGVSNTKLVRLFSVATRTKQAGGHDKLVATTAEKLKRAKDKDYVAKLDEFSNGRLLDMLQSAEGRTASSASRAAAKADGGGVRAAAKAARAARPAPAVAVAAKKAAKPEKSAKAKKSAAAVKSARAKAKKR
jgi:hypothetical protein